MAELSFILSWQVACARCGAVAEEETREMSLEQGSKFRFEHHIACSVCDAKIGAVIDSLLTYGAHRPECAKQEAEGGCTCGWDSFREACLQIMEE